MMDLQVKPHLGKTSTPKQFALETKPSLVGCCLKTLFLDAILVPDFRSIGCGTVNIESLHCL